jgi:hypothetical protein
MTQCRFRRVGPPGGRPVVVGGHLGSLGCGAGPACKNLDRVGLCAVAAQKSLKLAVWRSAVALRVMNRAGQLRAVFRGHVGGEGAVSGCSLACRKIWPGRCAVGSEMGRLGAAAGVSVSKGATALRLLILKFGQQKWAKGFFLHRGVFFRPQGSWRGVLVSGCGAANMS